MANPTSNYNWQMPTNTDLVKDLPADFEVFGQAVDTSLADLKGGTSGQILAKNSNTDMDFVWIANDQGDITAVNVTSPITGGGSSGAVTVGINDGTTAQKGAVQLEDSTSSTSTTKAATPNSVKSAYDLANAAIPKSLVDAAGDLIYATADNTVARLAIGTALQVLRVNSGATAPEWATASTGALSIIAPTSIANSGGTASASGGEVTFSGCNSVSLNGVFSATYDNYLVWIEANAAAGSRTGRMRLRASGTDNTTSNYRSGYMYSGFSGSTTGNDNRNNVDYWIPYYFADTASSSQSIFVSSPNLAKYTRFGTTFGINDANAHFSGVFVATTTFDGATFFPETTDTFTGKIRVYGYANS
jgi:hypothetical protein